MKVDFSKVSINATVEGDPVVIDLTKEVGNLVYGRTADIRFKTFSFFVSGRSLVSRPFF